MNMEVRDIERRIVESLTSDLEAFVFDTSLISIELVNSFLKKHGLWELFTIKNIGSGISVLLFDEKKIDSNCLYSSCSQLKSKEKEICLAKCRRKEINTLKTKLLKMLD